MRSRLALSVRAPRRSDSAPWLASLVGRAVGTEQYCAPAAKSSHCTRSGHMRRSGMRRVKDAKAAEELQRRSIVERLMGPDGVVRLLPSAELGIERVQMPVAVGHFVELFG